jgi:hypothetical protein
MGKMATMLAVALSALALTACDQLQQLGKSDAPVEAAAPEPSPASAGPAYVGTWAADAASCSIPQEQRGAPYVFHADGFNQHEAHCTWANVQDLGPTSWRIDAACQVEGSEASLGWTVSVDGDTMTMDSQRLVRCP